MEIERLKIDIECIVGKRSLCDSESMADVLKRLDEYSKIKDIPDRLRHYLTKRSYVKALAWLDDPEIPHEV